MLSKLERKFDDNINRLLNSRIHIIKSAIWTTRGPAPRLTKRKVTRSIEQLKSIAERVLLRSQVSKEILSGFDYKRQWHPKLGKGHGSSAKKRHFKRWYEKHITTKNCVYVFWSHKSCLYVGRTLNGKGRPSSHFEKHWFGKASRLDIYGFERKRDVPRFECMFTHRHKPSYSKIRPSSKKYYSQCPICETEKKIKNGVKSFFRLK
jgi:hypothetical protein